MGDVVGGAAQEIWSILVNAVTSPGAWALAGVVVVAAVVGYALRGRLGSPWVLIPALGAAGYWALRHFARW